MQKFFKHPRSLVAALVVLAALLAGMHLRPLHAQPSDSTAKRSVAEMQQSRSDRVVEYRIDARYDPNTKSVDATETLVYHNRTGQTLDRFPFHLYLNGFQPGSTWMRELRRSDPDQEWEPDMQGGIEIRSIEAIGIGDLKSRTRFIAPEDGNPQDRTVIEVELPRAVADGESVTFKIAFRSKFPKVVARTGYKGDFIMGAQWFPKLGVWWKGRWNAHQFHAATEFFSDFGVYDVKLTLPTNFVTGATGTETARHENSDGTRTLSFHAEDVHDFAWTADPRFIVTEDAYEGAHKVRIRLLMLPEHARQTARHLFAVKETMQLLERWFGAYPYEQITVVDPGAARAGGMEYPMLITAGTFWRMPKGVRVPEGVVAHEFGHQYWYGMEANNEFEEPWLDEGINSYTEIKVMEELFGRNGAYCDWLGAQISARGDYWREYIGEDATDTVGSSAVNMLNTDSVGVNAYNKPAMIFLTLESLIGEDGVLRGLRTFFEQNRFRHPTGQDLVAAMEQSSGKDLKWFFDQAINSTRKLDYAVSVNTYDLGKEGSPRRSEVVVLRKGDFVFPVTLEVTFANGKKVRELWDGQDRWKRFTYDSQEVASAQINPDHRVWLDESRFNDSYTTKPDRRASRKLTGYWIAAVQFLQQAIGWLS